MPEATAEIPTTTLVLARCGARDAGAALGLRKDDILVAIDGVEWRGSVTALRARMAGADRPAVLTFRRGETGLNVLATTSDLGQWQNTPAAPAPFGLPTMTDRMCNWEVMLHPDGSHDLIALRPALLALVAPPLWLAQMRLWTLLATLGAAMAIALPGGALLVGFVWAAAGLHLWRAGDRHLRVARMAEGCRKIGVVAAVSEHDARAAWAAVSPGARFRFDAGPATAEHPATA
jgi:hypothetical protein